MKRYSCVFALLLSLLMNPLFAENDNPMGIPPAMDRKIQTSLDHLFNMKFDAALRVLYSIDDANHEHPMVSFGITCTHWWRLSTLVLETDMQESQDFLSTVNECIDISRAKIKAGDPTGEGHLVYGGALGLLGRWQATNHQFMNAYFTGKKAYKYLVKATEINPNLSDANLGKGIFDYYVATLPAIVRILAFLGQGSDRNVGLMELEDAAANSFYAKVAAKTFLVDIYANQENRTDRSLEILADLKAQYQFSPFIQMLSVVSYYNQGNIEALRYEADTFIDRVEKGAYPESFKPQGYFFRGASFFREGKYEEAIQYFTQAIETKITKSAFYCWSYLYRGYALDILGKRDEAIKDYQTVLSQTRRWESWDHAQRRINKAFTTEDEETKKLKL